MPQHIGDLAGRVLRQTTTSAIAYKFPGPDQGPGPFLRHGHAVLWNPVSGTRRFRHIFDWEYTKTTLMIRVWAGVSGNSYSLISFFGNK